MSTRESHSDAIRCVCIEMSYGGPGRQLDLNYMTVCENQAEVTQSNYEIISMN